MDASDEDHGRLTLRLSHDGDVTDIGSTAMKHVFAAAPWMLLLFLLSPADNARAHERPTGLLAHFTFEDTREPSKAPRPPGASAMLEDRSGNGFHAEIVAEDGDLDRDSLRRESRFGDAVGFGGHAALVVPVDVHYELYPVVTIAGWLYVENENARGFLIGTDGGDGPALRVSGRSLIAEHSGGRNQVNKVLRPGRWIFFAALWDYADGTMRLTWGARSKEETFGTGNLKPPGQDVILGARNHRLASPAEGVRLDEIRIFGRRLNERELDTLRDQQPGETYSAEQPELTYPGADKDDPANHIADQGSIDDDLPGVEQPTAAPSPYPGPFDTSSENAIADPDFAENVLEQSGPCPWPAGEIGSDSPRLEIGNTEAGDTWQSVSLSYRRSRPVIIAGVPTHRGRNPGIVRLKCIRDGEFQIRFQEWNYRERDHADTEHLEEDIPYLAIEAGRYQFEDGSIWEAGIFGLTGVGDFKTVQFKKDFPGRPHLFLTVQTEKGEQAVIARARGLDASKFEVALFEEEALNSGDHVKERVGYLAIYSAHDAGRAGSGATQYGYWLSRENLDHRWAPAISTELMLEEEQSADSETAHDKTEMVNVADIDGRIFGQAVTYKGADPFGLRRRDSTPEKIMDRYVERFLSEFRSYHGRSVAQSVDHHNVAGLTLVFVKGRLPVARRHWGQRNVVKDWPTTDSTLYQAASMTKVVAGLGFAGAARRGDLSLDDTVADFVRRHPDGTIAKWERRYFKGESAQYPKEITYRRLLSHTAGLNVHGIGTILYSALAPCDSLRSIILGHIASWDCNGVKPVRPPGILWDYSGGGFTVAEQMLETEVGESFADYMERHVLDAFGLPRSTFEEASRSMTNLARGCSRKPCVSGVQSTRVKAAGGLLADPGEFAHLIRLIMNDGKKWSISNNAPSAQIIPYRDIRNVLRPVPKKYSTFSSCAGGCPVRATIKWEQGVARPADEEIEEQCVLGRCQESFTYGLGTNVSRPRDIDRGGLPQRFWHGGSQHGFKSFFRADRHTHAAMVLFVNGRTGGKDCDRCGGKFRKELNQAYRDAFP
ncbi:serine hydrolase [Lentisalinibacter salinarum]|uniref:serine hydrolase n=1 Tax=Lentisalinibacter salinarum TaxID=2992239 RepID=UPI003864F4CE